MSFILRDESRNVEQMKSEKCICVFLYVCVCCGVCSCV